MRNTLCITAAALGFFTATPACAQYGVLPDAIASTLARAGNAGKTAKCLEGWQPSAKRVKAIGVEIAPAMLHYVKLAGAGVPGDASAAFVKDVQRRGWTRNDTPGSPSAVDDPLARTLAGAGAPLSPPAEVIGSGDKTAALALWPVADQGYYRVLFRREGSAWKVERLDLVEGQGAPEAIHQFCNAPGDVERYLATPRNKREAARNNRQTDQSARDDELRTRPR